MRKKRSFILIFAILTGLLASLLPWGTALAHAELVRSVPAAGENLAQPPVGVEIFMSEAVEPSLSEISIYNSAGQQVDNRDTHQDPANEAHLIVSLPSLPSGIYTVYWKTASEDDGHPTGGSFNFSVGLPAGAGIATPVSTTQASDMLFSPAEVIAKGLLYLATALLVGGIVFFLYVYRPAAVTSRSNPEPAAFRKFWIAALILTGLATLGGIGAEAGLLGGGFLTVLLSTRAGLLALARLAVILALAGLLAPPENRWNRKAALPLALLLLLTISLLSHAAAQTENLLPVTLDVVHLAAACAWAGGLGFFLGAVLWLRRAGVEASKRGQLIALILGRFSTLALVSAGVLILTGTYAAVIDIGSWRALLNTVYGQALMVKLELAFAMLFVGGLNHFIHRPRLEKLGAPDGEAAPEGLLKRFRISLAVEVFLSAALLLWVGVFTSLPPAKPIMPEIVRTAQAADGEMNLRLAISPGKVGLNTFTLQVSPASNAPIDVTGASLAVFSSNTSLPPNDIELDPEGEQTYTNEAYVLGYPDLWQIRMIVQRANHLDAHADVSVDLRPQPGLSQETITWLLAISLAAALVFAVWAISRGHKPGRWETVH